MEFTKQRFREEMQFKSFPAGVAVGPEKAQGQFRWVREDCGDRETPFYCHGHAALGNCAEIQTSE